MESRTDTYMSLCKSWLWIQIKVFSYTYHVFIKESLHLDEALYIFIALRSKGIYADTLHCAEGMVHRVNSLRIKIQRELSHTGASWGGASLCLSSRVLTAHTHTPELQLASCPLRSEGRWDAPAQHRVKCQLWKLEQLPGRYWLPKGF